MNKLFPFKIGADPEFSFVLENRRISADKLITALFKKDHEPENKEDSSESMGYKVGQNGVIGWDGVHDTGELRPKASNDPCELVDNIGALVKSFAAKAKIFQISTTSEKAPCGGHVHFELPKTLHNRETAIDNLHKKMSSFYLPIMLSEDIISSRVRMKLGDQVGQPYGKIIDYRYDWRDDKQTIQSYELRVPSAEWLTTPEISKAVICYLATVYNEVVYNPKNFKKAQGIFFQTKKQSLALQELAMSQYTMLIRLVLGKIKHFIRTFEFYPQYKAEIELALNPNKILAIKRKAEFDMVKGWDLISAKEPTKRQLLSEKQLKKEALKTDLDSLQSLIRVPYNPDVNVENFARAMKARIVALNWKPCNTYYLFGLRTGIKDYIIINRDWKILAGQEIIKTRLDYDTVKRTFENMMDKFNNSGWYKPDDPSKAIYVGLPYDDRIKLSTRRFIDILWSIEKGHLVPKDIVKEGLIDDTRVSAKNDRNIGRIFQIYNEEKLDSNLSDSALESQTRRNEILTRTVRQEVEAERSTRDDLAVALAGNNN